MQINKFKDRIIPLTIITLGIYIAIIPYFFKLYFDIPYWELASILITIGILLFGYQEIRNKLNRIEQELEIDKGNKVTKAKLISNDIANDFMNVIRKKKYIYKASIYLPSSEMDNLFLIQNLISNIKIDSKIRLIINTSGSQDLEKSNLENLSLKRKSDIDLKVLESKIRHNYSIVILDTDVWIINDYGEEVDGNLIFCVSSYNQHGKSFIDLFNKFWDKSKNYSKNQI